MVLISKTSLNHIWPPDLATPLTAIFTFAIINHQMTPGLQIRADEDQFLRLLELLGEWYEVGKVLVFVHSQIPPIVFKAMKSSPSNALSARYHTRYQHQDRVFLQWVLCFVTGKRALSHNPNNLTLRL
eukprot:7992372-Pyramimonas_sp.AAC.1